jgi:hypothetical protein
MDRWGYLDWWKKTRSARRAQLVPGWVEACILAAVVTSIFGTACSTAPSNQDPSGVA